MLRPFFKIQGGKTRLGPGYVPPQYDHVVEPFAGGAGFSLYWEPPQVTVVEIDEDICGVWRYLRKVSPAEVMRLPANIMHIDELPSWVCPEARRLIGFNLDHSVTRPAARRSNWSQRPWRWGSSWSETKKSLIASQVNRIRHWKIIEGSYELAPNVEAHWFVDPPYDNAAGRNYRYHDIDYPKLANWCKSRRGFVQVCEQEGSMWLPFEPFGVVPSHRPRGYSKEASYVIDNRKSTRGHGSLRRDRRRKRHDSI